MAKIAIATVADVLKRSNLDAEVLKTIIQALQEEVNAVEDEKEEKPPPQKKQWAILVSDPDGDLAEKNLVGWVVQIPEEANVATIPERIHKASYDFNSSKRGRKHPVSTVGEACEAVSAKHFKEADISVKTKIPVAVILTDNEIPGDDEEDGLKVDKRRTEID